MRPYVICHMCTSLDGRILSSRWGKLPGYESPSKLFETTAASFGIGAWLVGTTTMRELAQGSHRAGRAHRGPAREDHLDLRAAKTFAIGADAKGTLRFTRDEVGGDRVVLLVSEKVSDDFLAGLRAAGVSYLFCGKSAVEPARALAKLREKVGLRKLMLEGGGRWNGALLRDGLVDEVSQIIVPVIDGGEGVTGAYECGELRAAAASLRLTSLKKLKGGAVWLRYRVR